MPLILYSRCCREGFRHQGGQLPTYCPRCAKPVEEWVTYDELPGPTVPWHLEPLDVKFLKVLKIDPQLEPVEDDGA